ncbi:superoxide dismutase [Rickettsia endosymbiont of Cardiosporidium cionae]|uniref:superoxide dismutase n=1 Tax=Rickettsia endosymbiont of Cardiosporidium cionae TaxID=2777155 RepID=UPI001893F51A|nr:superoxide dismutase [Rickettsia endosymbiont of Cardiosporidium cionae]KAF8818174.1 superoxide dismutase [Rickettsia endosymbiont of Cardiosporidium cionae]
MVVSEFSYCDKANQTCYPFLLQDLPFSKDSFGESFSAETFDYHHGKHHNAYVVNLNKLIKDNESYHNKSLENIIDISYLKDPMVFNNAAQIWNHNFFWCSITPVKKSPSSELLNLIENRFTSYQLFTEEFRKVALSQFGSGWAWLVFVDNQLEILKTSNAETPICLNKSYFPLLACDVWEHAYYIDYRNRRPDYITTYLEYMINWDFVSDQLKKAAIS